jgi:hypothetical protein
VQADALQLHQLDQGVRLFGVSTRIAQLPKSTKARRFTSAISLHLTSNLSALPHSVSTAAYKDNYI